MAETQKNAMVWLNYIRGEYSGTILFLSSQAIGERRWMVAQVCVSPNKIPEINESVTFSV